jgi:hypothetical protein
MTWQSKPLRFGGVCDACGAQIEVKAVGWHNPELKKVRCISCGPPAEAEATHEVLAGPELTPDPIGGSAALREARSRRDPKWIKGAAGEYLMDQSLHKQVSEDSVILTDRRVPGAKSNIDHIVIASSGVWIIDTKNWRGRIEYKAPSSTSVDTRLFVGGKDRTSVVEAMYSMVIPVAQAIGDRSVPVKPALVFVDGDWALSALPRMMINRPYKHLGVWILPPKNLSRLINEPGPLNLEAIQSLGKKLDQLFVPA